MDPKCTHKAIAKHARIVWLDQKQWWPLRHDYWLWKWPFCPVKQYMYPLRSHFSHWSLIVLLATYLTAVNSVLLGQALFWGFDCTIIVCFSCIIRPRYCWKRNLLRQSELLFITPVLILLSFIFWYYIWFTFVREPTTPWISVFNVKCEKMLLKMPMSALKVLFYMFTVFCFYGARLPNLWTWRERERSIINRYLHIDSQQLISRDVSLLVCLIIT